MTTPANDKKFAGYIPRMYDTYFVPLLFEPYAADLGRRIAAAGVSRILELAAGTGVLTRALDSALAESVSIVATDLNQPMLDQAAAIGTRRRVEWRQADAMHLPFEDESFDCVVCQFGVMFFPDKPKAFAEAKRVLRPGGRWVFNVWDRIEANDLSVVVVEAMAEDFADNPAGFFVRTPHGYHDKGAIVRDLAAGGFTGAPDITTLTLRSRAASARDAALGFCQGSPLRNEIIDRDPDGLDAATESVTLAIARRFGHHGVDAKMQAHIVAVRK